MTDRGVSDLVAFTLVFATIVSMIGVITLGGLTAIDDVRQGTEADIAETTMVGYADTLATHRIDGVPTQSMTIELQGDSLRLLSSTVRVNVSGGPTRRFQTGALVRTTATDAQLVYDSGSLFRIEDDTSFPLRRPPFRCADDSAHISIVSLSGDVNTTTTGSVTATSELTGQHLVYPTTGSNTNRVNVTTAGSVYSDTWNQTLDAQGDWQQSDGTFQCRGLDHVVVRQTNVTIDIVS